MTTTMQKVIATQDESGHWYVIPQGVIGEYYRDEENDDMIDSGAFDDKWSKYRTGGDLNLIQLYANIDD